MTLNDPSQVLQQARHELETLDLESTHEVASWFQAFADRLKDGLDEAIEARRALAYERERAQRYLDIACVVIVAIDIAGRVTLINRKGCELLGRREEDILGLDWFENFIPEGMRQETRAVFDQVMAGELEPVEFCETAVLTATGERWVAWHNIVLTDEQGRAQGSLSSGEDVSDRRDLDRVLEERVAERTAFLLATQEELQGERDKLQREKERAQRYLDVARVALVALDRKGRITMINRCGCALLDKAEEEVLGKIWVDEYIAPQDQDMWRGMFADLLTADSEVTREGEAHVRTATGGERLITWHNTLVKATTGSVTGILSCAEDVTDRRRATVELKDREAQLRLITDSLPILIARIDKEGKYLFNNAAYEDFFGISRAALQGMHVREVVGEQVFDSCLPHIQQAMQGESPVFDLQFINKEGQNRDMQVLLVPDRGTSGEIAGFYAVISDQTEGIQLKRALHQAQKMEAIGRLASGIAHDFNNILMGIGGCSNLALSRLEEDSPARIFIDEIRSSATSGASISRQLLDLAGKKTVETTEVRLDALVAETESMLRRLVGADVSLHFDLRAGPSRLRIAPGQIEQILMNLILNARDAVAPGGRIDIETVSVDLNAEMTQTLGGIRPGPYVVLSVRDTGSGMDAATMERIFEPFFTTKEVGQGTGLGLSTVYGIVSGMGGYIDVHSSVGKGTVLTVYLPMSERQVREPRPSPPSVPGGHETVLVVEDDRLVQLAVDEYLGRSGYQVLSARDGTEAVRVAREHAEPIPLLISDMVLPGMSGSEVARAVVEIHPEARVLYMSAHSHEMLVEAGHLRPDDDVETLQKPFGEDELLARVREALAEDSPAEPTSPLPH